MSILSTSPTSIRVFDVNIANALGSSEAATILQQLHYWMQKPGVGVMVDGVKYVYNTFRQWIKEQFLYLSESKFINAMKILRSLEIVKVIRHKAKNWIQTNHYSLDYQKLREWAEAESIEIFELADNLSQDNRTETLEANNPKKSLYRTKSTHKEEQQSRVAADSSQVKKTESEKSKPKCDGVKSSSSPVREKEDIFSNKQNTGKDKSSAKVDAIINIKWEDQLKDLDGAGIPVNKTLTRLLKSFKFEQVESAIALFKNRKREQHIPNPCGYFTEALKQNWAGENLAGTDLEINTADLFRYWYDLAKQLGYCSEQEMRDNEQWVCVSGSWEKWSDAVERGYSIDYLKKIIRRNGGK